MPRALILKGVPYEHRHQRYAPDPVGCIFHRRAPCGERRRVCDRRAGRQGRADSVSVYTHKFKKPVTFEGCTFDELTFDFGRLTGNDSLAIEDEMEAMNKPVIVPTFSGQYLTRVAARACTTMLTSSDGKQRRVGADVIMALPISDYSRIRGRARTFLLKSEL